MSPPAPLRLAPGETLSLGPVVVQNNAWGRGDLRPGRDFHQSAEITPEAVVFTWSWPPPETSPGVRAYPEVFAGRKPWGPETGGEALPAPLAAAESLAVRYAFTAEGDPAGFTPAFDLWLSPDPAGGPAALTHEIMVWLAPGPRRPAGRPVARLDAADGLPGPATLWAKPEHGRHGWTYLAAVLDAPAPAGRLELGPLLAALRAEGLAPAEGWLLAVELGAEIKGGAGRLAIHDFALVPAAEARLAAPDPFPPALPAEGP